MILLEAGNKIIAESLQFRIENLVAGDKAETLDSHLADFDTVQYHLATPSAENRHVVRLSMRMPCFTAELANYGAVQVLEREYAGLGIQIGTKASPGGVLEDGFDVSLQWDMAAVSVDKRDELVRKVALLKTFSMGAPLEKAAREQLDGKPGNLMTISYRDHESIYVKASHDRVTVIFTTLFRDETDKILAKVFLQEFVDCRKQPGLQNAPQALFTNREPPMELRHLPAVAQALANNTQDIGYVTFVLNPRHYTTPAQRTATVQLVQYFRDYLHYHIKCSKAYMHSRMRAKVDSWTKVLNRAKPDLMAEPKERKTASGKTFVRK